MEKAVKVMKASIRETRDDDAVPPKVGAVLWWPDGRTDTASRGELREGDHAEYTLIERKHGDEDLSSCVLFATLEPCGPDARNPPKIGCARRITNARIKKVYYGREDPHPRVAGEGLRYLKEHGVEVIPFDREFQEEINLENRAFFEQALVKAAEEEQATTLPPLPHDRPAPLVSLQDLDAGALEAYKSFLLKGNGGDEALFHRRLLYQGLLHETDDQGLLPTGFAFLLFGKDPRDVFPQAGVLATFERPTGDELENFDGPMSLAPEKVLKWLRGKLPDEIDRSTARRGKIQEPFYEMVREGLVNAIMHRDYDMEGAKIQFLAEEDKVVIRSPGAPMPPITLEDLQNFTAPMVSRNPRLHAVFSTMELAEERGLGLKSLRTRAREAGLPLPTYSFREPYLDLTIYRTPEAALHALPKEMLDELSDSEREGWEWLTGFETVTASDYESQLKIPRRTVLNHFNSFIDLGLLKKEGSGSATRYRVLQP
ncbi:MAG: ATP-binding protein [Kiritimatiellia bacterium]